MCSDPVIVLACVSLYSPVSYGKVFLLLQRMNEGDQEVFVVEKSGKQRDSLLQVRPHAVRRLTQRGETRNTG